MALISCIECGNKISERAITCPQCGAPNEEVEIATESQKPVELNPGASKKRSGPDFSSLDFKQSKHARNNKRSKVPAVISMLSLFVAGYWIISQDYFDVIGNSGSEDNRTHSQSSDNPRSSSRRTSSVQKIDPACDNKRINPDRFPRIGDDGKYYFHNDRAFGTESERTKTIKTLIRNGQYRVISARSMSDGMWCLVDIHIEGIANGNSYKGRMDVAAW